MTGAVASQRVTEALKGFLSTVGNRAKSVKAKGSLIARHTGRARTKVGLSDPVFQDLIQGLWLGSQYYKGGIPRMTPHRLASMLHSLPPILYM